MNKKKTFMIVLIATLLIYIGVQIAPYDTEKNASLFYRGNTTKVIAHGGAKAMYPENTVYAFEEVMEYPVDVLEVDLHITKDDYLIGVHNDTINAYTANKGHVYNYNYEELLEMNFAHHFKDKNDNYIYRDVNEEMRKKLVPIEAGQLLDMYNEKVLYIFEIKDTGKRGKRAVEILNDIVKNKKLQKQVCICSFDKVVMEYYLTMKDKSISTVMDYNTSKDFVISNYYGYGGFLNFPYEGLMFPTIEQNVGLDSRYLIWKAHKNNKFIYYWTIDDPKEMQKLIDYGADGIITDRVDILVELLYGNKQ